MKERRDLAWFWLGMWKLKGTRRDVEKGDCPLFNEEENEIYAYCWNVKGQMGGEKMVWLFDVLCICEERADK